VIPPLAISRSLVRTAPVLGLFALGYVEAYTDHPHDLPVGPAQRTELILERAIETDILIRLRKPLQRAPVADERLVVLIACAPEVHELHADQLVRLEF
jgi:hypothetical protein